MNKTFKKFKSKIKKIFDTFSQNKMRSSPKRNLHNILWERATEQSANFVEQYLNSCMIFNEKEQMWNYLSNLLNDKFKDGLCLEFGVGEGASINYLSKLLSNFSFVGFDSFVGLKEDWIGHHATKGAYSQNANFPDVNSNVKLISGWFDHKLPDYIKNNKDKFNKLRLIHIDSDTYESATSIFDELAPYLSPKIYILFDELIGYPNWQNGEFKALEEAKSKYKFEYKYRAFSSEQALIEIL